MSTPLRLLIVEDRMTDVEIMLQFLGEAGFAPDFVRVETEAEYRSQLGLGFEVILSDYTLPQFDAPRALELLLA